MITIRHERTADFDARETLLDGAFGEGRAMKTSERLREGRLPSNGLSFVATEDDQIVGTARLWDISAGPRPARAAARAAGGRSRLAEARRRQGADEACGPGGAAARPPCRAAGRRCADSCRFGFMPPGSSAEPAAGSPMSATACRRQSMPGALDGARGLIGATGQFQPKPELRVLVARLPPARRRSSSTARRGAAAGTSRSSGTQRRTYVAVRVELLLLEHGVEHAPEVRRRVDAGRGDPLPVAVVLRAARRRAACARTTPRRRASRGAGPSSGTSRRPCRARLCIQPVAASWRIPASTSG